jgi:hypothetical protein
MSVQLCAPDGDDAEQSILTSVAAILGLALIAVIAVAPGWLPGHVPGEFTPIMQWTTLAANRLAHGQLALWNDQAGLGEPLAGAGQVAVFYPGMLVHIVLPPAWAWGVAAALHLWLAGVGAWLLAGRAGLRAVGRLAVGATFMLCGPSVLGINHVQGNVIAWVPWAVLAVERLIERVSIWRIIVAALVFAVQFLGGSVAASAGLLVACVAVCVVQLVWTNPLGALRAGPAVVLALVLSTALASMEVLPYVEGVLWRGVEATARGTTVDGWGARLVAYGGLALVFVGTIPLLLAGLGLALGWRQRRTLVWVLVTWLSGLIALTLLWSGPLKQRWGWVRLIQDPALLSGAGLGLAMLAGMGMDLLLSLVRQAWDASRWVRWQKALYVGAAATGAVALVVAVTLWARFGAGAVFTRGGARLLGPGVALAVMAVILRSVRDPASALRLPRLCLGLVAANLLAFSVVQTWGPRAAGIESMKARAAAATQPVVIQPPAPATTEPAPATQPSLLPARLAGMPRLWLAKRVELCSSRQDALARANTDERLNPQQVALVDSGVSPEFMETLDLPEWQNWWQRSGGAMAGRIEYRAVSPEKLVVNFQACTGGWLVVSNAYWAGWRATVDRHETLVFPAFGAIQAVPLMVFNSEVVLEYWPRSLRYGVFASAGGGLVLLLLCGMGLFDMGAKKQKQP